MKIHIVQKGDTLWKIAKKYEVDFEELKKLNSQLSNPDMIMPGMKVKVPSAGGSIVKDVGNIKKEIPQAIHPFAQQQPPTLPVQKEMIKEVPKKEMIVHKETIYAPKMPQPVIPEIDINNYYMMNMAQIQSQQAPPPPVYLEQEIESVESPIIMPVQEECYPMYPSYMMPVPDCGCGPDPYAYQYPYMAPMPAYGMPVQGTGMTMPVLPHQELWVHHHYEDESSSSSMPMMSYPHAGGHVDGNVPYQPYYQPQPHTTNVIQQGFDLGGRQELQQMPGQQGFPGGQYMGGQYMAGQYTTGHYPGGQHMGGQYATGHYPGGQHMGGQYATGHYPGEQHMGGQYATGHYPGEHYMGTQYPTEHYSSGQYMGGQYSGGYSPSGQQWGGQYPGGYSPSVQHLSGTVPYGQQYGYAPSEQYGTPYGHQGRQMPFGMGFPQMQYGYPAPREDDDCDDC